MGENKSERDRQTEKESKSGGADKAGNGRKIENEAESER